MCASPQELSLYYADSEALRQANSLGNMQHRQAYSLNRYQAKSQAHNNNSSSRYYMSLGSTWKEHDTRAGKRANAWW
jgi:hypothetical protein